MEFDNSSTGIEVSNDKPLNFEGSEVYLKVSDKNKQQALDVYTEIEEAIKNPEPTDNEEPEFLKEEKTAKEDTNKGFLFDEEQRAKLSQFYPEDVLFDVEMKEPNWQNDVAGKVWVTAFNDNHPAKLTRIMKEDETFYEVSYERKGQNNREESTDNFQKAFKLLKNWHKEEQGSEMSGNSKQSGKPSFL